MSGLAKSVQEWTEGRIDFEGQAFVELISRVVLIGSAIVAFIVGFVMQSLAVTFVIFGGTTAVLALVVLPPWPMFNAHPVEWLPKVETKEKGK
ncbi:hypothetical protein H2248_002053 [Termitomyces sp. 'cryptogamus']|nr:hypothetical protein H2248_002053 [Termitomyces sp. 'cryptogamus']